MKKQILAVVCSAALVFAFGACKKKTEQPVPQGGMPGQQQLPPGHPPMGGEGAGGGVVMPKGETTVTLPDSVKGKWKAIVVTVEDKASKKKNDYTINLNSDFKIPGSNLTMSVGDFLPDFKMEGLTITSSSNELNNPAAKVKVVEGDKEVFKGWLYSKFPAIHPFEHPKYAITLKNAVKKG